MWFTRQPKLVETVCGPRPRGENRAENEVRRERRGRSSPTTTHDRTQERSTPRLCEEEKTGNERSQYVRSSYLFTFSWSVALPSSLQQTSMAAYEQYVSRILLAETTDNHSDGLVSKSYMLSR